MASRLDQALDEVIRDRRTERGGSSNNNNSNNNNSNNSNRRNNNNNRNTRRENGGGGIRKRAGGNNNSNSSPAIRSFVRTVNVMEERRGGASRNVNSQWSHDMFDDEDVPRSSILSRLGDSREGRGGRSDRGVEICVENLHYNVTEEDVKELFNTVADVTKAKLVFDPSGRSTGLAYISYQSMSDAEKAIDKYNNIKLDGQAMQIKINERPAPKSRSSGSGGRFNNDRLSNRLGGRLGSSDDRRNNDKRDNFRQKKDRSNKTFKNNDKKDDRHKKIPTAEDLDKEMESYMQSNASQSNDNSNIAAFEEDIDMILD